MVISFSPELIGRERRCTRTTIRTIMMAASVLLIASSFIPSTTAFFSTRQFVSKLKIAPYPLPKQRYNAFPRSSSSTPPSSSNHHHRSRSFLTMSGYSRPIVNWYPGHIAKAEKLLSETLKSVDVVIEVRDARAPKATAHPRVAEWTAGRPRIVVLTKLDMVPRASVKRWTKGYETFGAGRWDGTVDGRIWNTAVQALNERTKYVDVEGRQPEGRIHSSKLPKKKHDNDIKHKNSPVSKVEDVIFVDARLGKNIHAIHKAIYKAGRHVNERRSRRGLSDRALRVGIIGYPNVGKSALINRILGRKRAKTANIPGVTRSLQWIRVRTDATTSVSGKVAASSKTEFELLDSPGIIPANMLDRSDALLLAACNSIGDAAYDNQAVAAYLFEWIKTLHLMNQGNITSPQWPSKCKDRYQFDPLKPPTVPFPRDDGQSRLMTGEDMLFQVADNTCQGDPENAARKMLQDFRSGRLGPIALQLAPETDEDRGQKAVQVRGGEEEEEEAAWREVVEKLTEERKKRAAVAVEIAKEKGLELPPMVLNKNGVDDEEGVTTKEEEIGKGLFEGW